MVNPEMPLSSIEIRVPVHSSRDGLSCKDRVFNFVIKGCGAFWAIPCEWSKPPSVYERVCHSELARNLSS
jgi:hypothetical protein